MLSITIAKLIRNYYHFVKPEFESTLKNRLFALAFDNQFKYIQPIPSYREDIS